MESFASDSKILFSRAFEAEIKVPDADAGVWTHFLVAPKGQTDLLSKTTAFALGVLKIGYSVNQICNATDSSTISPEFPKLPGVSLKIQVDEQIKPIVQAARRLPISMEADVEKVGYIFFSIFWIIFEINLLQGDSGSYRQKDHRTCRTTFLVGVTVSTG